MALAACVKLDTPPLTVTLLYSGIIVAGQRSSTVTTCAVWVEMSAAHLRDLAGAAGARSRADIASAYGYATRTKPQDFIIRPPLLTTNKVFVPPRAALQPAVPAKFKVGHKVDLTEREPPR